MMHVFLVDYKTTLEDEYYMNSLLYDVGDYRVVLHQTASEKDPNHIICQTFEVHKNVEKDYIPDIYCINPFLDYNKPEFKICTTSYGSQSPEVIEQIIEGYQKAIEVVNALTEYFC